MKGRNHGGAAASGKAQGAGGESTPLPAPIDQPVTGLMLHQQLAAAAAARGVLLGRFVNPLRGAAASITFLRQLKGSKRPTQSTIDRVTALIAGQPIPPPPTRRRLPRSDLIGAAPITVRAPRHDRPGVAPGRLVIGDACHPEDWRTYEGRGPRVPAIAGDAEERRELFAGVTDQVPSFQQAMRQILAEWPDQWARVRAIAAELALLPGDAFGRVIAAGLTCLEEGGD